MRNEVFNFTVKFSSLSHEKKEGSKDLLYLFKGNDGVPIEWLDGSVMKKCFCWALVPTQDGP